MALPYKQAHYLNIDVKIIRLRVLVELLYLVSTLLLPLRCGLPPPLAAAHTRPPPPSSSEDTLTLPHSAPDKGFWMEKTALKMSKITQHLLIQMSNCYYVNRGLKCPLPIFQGIQESLSCIF